MPQFGLQLELAIPVTWCRYTCRILGTFIVDSTSVVGDMLQSLTLVELWSCHSGLIQHILSCAKALQGSSPRHACISATSSVDFFPLAGIMLAMPSHLISNQM